jgi:hypothetical protein
VLDAHNGVAERSANSKINTSLEKNEMHMNMNELASAMHPNDGDLHHLIDTIEAFPETRG